MPWQHCGERIPDDGSCPTCGINKTNWTVFFDRTREFTVSRAVKVKKLKLRLWDEEQEDVVGEERFVVLSLDGSKTLKDGVLDAEGYATVSSRGWGEMVLVRFPNRAPGCVVPAADCEVDEPTPGRFACLSTSLYEFRLAGHWIEATVLDWNGEPLAGEPYELLAGQTERREGVTDEAGFLRQEHLPPGECILRLPQRDLRDCSIPPPEFDEPATLHEGWIEVTLLDSDGKPLAEEPFTLVFEDETERAGQTDAGGWARFENIPEGTARVVFPERVQSDFGPYDPDAVTFGRRREAPEPPNAWIEVTLLDSDGAPLAEEPYVLTAGDGRERSGTTDASGYLREEGLPSGRVSLRLANRVLEDFGVYEPDRLQLPGGAPDGPEPPSAWIELTLLDSDGAALMGEPYVLLLEDGCERKGTADASGYVREEGLPPGRVTLRLPERSAEDFGVYEPDPVQLPDGKPPEPQLPSDWIELSFLDGDGAPLAGEPYVLVLGDGCERTGSTDGSGYVREENLPPGGVTLRLPERTATDVTVG